MVVVAIFERSVSIHNLIGTLRHKSTNIVEKLTIALIVHITKPMPPHGPVVAGPSRAPAQSPEVPDSDAATEEQTDGSEDLAQDERVCLAPREWTFVRILDRRDDTLPKVDEYQVRWARTRHPTAHFRISKRGRLRVKVGNRPWQIVPHVKAKANRRTGKLEGIVEWADTWHTIWQIPSAFSAVASFERRNPRPDKQTMMGTKPDLRDWPLFLKAFRDPEAESKTDDVDDRIQDFTFDIEEDVDYTASFLRHCIIELEQTGKLVSPAIATLLCMPRRQKLIFNPEYATLHGRFSGNSRIWRILPVYIAGLARRTPCSHCANSPREKLLFEFCVSWFGIFAGACVNCVFAGCRLSSLCDSRSGELIDCSALYFR